LLEFGFYTTRKPTELEVRLMLSWFSGCIKNNFQHELELELIQTQMTQKPVLRAEVYAHAMRASQNRK